MKVNTTSYIAEYLGAFLFILSIFASGGNPLIIGTTLAVVIYLIGPLSGAHVNPAVSVSMFLNGDLTSQQLLAYAVAQLLGGASAYYSYRLL
jgi:aquaporin Z